MAMDAVSPLLTVLMNRRPTRSVPVPLVVKLIAAPPEVSDSWNVFAAAVTMKYSVYAARPAGTVPVSLSISTESPLTNPCAVDVNTSVALSAVTTFRL